MITFLVLLIASMSIGAVLSYKLHIRMLRLRRRDEMVKSFFRASNYTRIEPKRYNTNPNVYGTKPRRTA
jgi:hypothetical protein